MERKLVTGPIPYLNLQRGETYSRDANKIPGHLVKRWDKTEDGIRILRLKPERIHGKKRKWKSVMGKNPPSPVNIQRKREKIAFGFPGRGSSSWSVKGELGKGLSSSSPRRGTANSWTKKLKKGGGSGQEESGIRGGRTARTRCRASLGEPPVTKGGWVKKKEERRPVRGRCEARGRRCPRIIE